MNDAMNATPKTIRINGRDYSVSEQTACNGEKQYILTGKRGATYGTMRNKNTPHLMFLIDCRGFGKTAGSTVWLSDEGGNLRVVK